MRLKPFYRQFTDQNPRAGTIDALAVREWLFAELVASYSLPKEQIETRLERVEGPSELLATPDSFFGFCLRTVQGDPYLWASVERKGQAARAESLLRAVLKQSPFAWIGISSDSTPEGTRVLRKKANGECISVTDIEQFARPPTRSRIRLRPLAETAENLFFEAHSHIRDIDGMHADESLDELCKVLCAKIYDEKQGRINQVGTLRRELCDSSEEFAALVRRAYSDATACESRIASPIRLSTPALVKVAEALQNYSLSTSSIDVKGRAFQRVLTPALRAGMGQYFTPLPVIQFMVDVAMPTFQDRIIDPFAGSGHFLTECLKAVQRTTSPRSEKKIDAYVRRHLYGIEKNDRMVRVAETDIQLRGNQRFNLQCADSLLPFENYTALHPASFDLVLTNPPFGSRLGSEAISQLDRFELCQGRGSVPLEVIGLERSVQLLRPGGRLGIVLPDGVLANRGTKYVREWLAQSVKLRAIVSLPVETFTPFGANIKTSILFARKWEAGESVNVKHSVFLARVDNVGYDASGRPQEGCELNTVSEQLRGFLAKEGW